MEAATISIIISCTSILGSLGTYIIHDRKIKAQQDQINKYEISKIESAKLDAQKAKVRAIYIESPGRLTIKICNKGHAIAKNIRIEFNPNDISDFTRMNQFPFPYLNPEDNTEIYMLLHNGMPDSIEIKMIWDDDFKNNNEYAQIMTI